MLGPQVNPIVFVLGNLAQAIPGMIIQLVFIPMLIKFMTSNAKIKRVLAQQ